MKGFDYEVAERFFNNNVCSCGKNLNRDVISLNMKLFGRETNSRLCLKCLSNYLELPQKELKIKIKQFKDDGCSIF